MANLCAWHRCARERGAPGRCPALFLGRSDGLGSRFGGLPGSGAAWAPPRTASQGPCRTSLPRSEWFFSADPCTLRLGKVLNCGYLAPRRLQKSLRGRVREKQLTSRGRRRRGKVRPSECSEFVEPVRRAAPMRRTFCVPHGCVELAPQELPSKHSTTLMCIINSAMGIKRRRS